MTPEWVDSSIAYINKKTQLKASVYPPKITTDEELTAYHHHFREKTNTTQIGLIYCGAAASPEQLLLHYFCDGDKDYTYYLVLNKTEGMSVMFYDLLEPMPVDDVAVSLKVPGT
jgi:hypothetical protein